MSGLRPLVGPVQNVGKQVKKVSPFWRSRPRPFLWPFGQRRSGPGVFPPGQHIYGLGAPCSGAHNLDPLVQLTLNLVVI